MMIQKKKKNLQGFTNEELYTTQVAPCYIVKWLDKAGAQRPTVKTRRKTSHPLMDNNTAASGKRHCDRGVTSPETLS